jgi:polar amino acid transport system substrate-binding protein
MPLPVRLAEPLVALAIALPLFASAVPARAAPAPAIAVGPAASGAGALPPVRLCADPDPPPWTYWVRDPQGHPTKRFTGFSVELATAAFARIGRRVEFIGDLPWVRCLHDVRNGRIDFAMDGYFDAERAKRFTYTRHYSTLTPQVFFPRGAPIDIATRDDLRRYRGCGMSGASYAHYGLRAADLDLGVTAYDQMVRKLQAGRCQYFVEELEIIEGFRMIGRDYLGNGAIEHRPVPGVAGPAKHLLAARGGGAAKLVPALDAAITALVDSGEAERMWKRHAGGLPYRP